MLQSFKFPFFFLLVSFFSCHPSSLTEAQNTKEDPISQLQVETIVETSLYPPITILLNPEEKSYWIAEQTGAIKELINGQVSPKPIADFSKELVTPNPGYDERGFLGMAFHPNFPNDRRLFVYLSVPSSSGERGNNHASEIRSYIINSNNTLSNAYTLILRVPQPEGNHNGGHLLFGPDGYLYIGIGDGGGAGDKHGPIGNAQDTSNLLGKILRIDVNKTSPYSIPSDNPFVGKAGKDEIWAFGLRNPWRFSFDQNGSLIAGDVGQNKYEEINVIKKGANYGWRAFEATHPFDGNLKIENAIPPIAEYPHSFGISVCGGFVYRGNQLKGWQGRYIFADWNGKLLYLNTIDGPAEIFEIDLGNQNLQKKSIRILSMAEDENGEILLLAQKGHGPLDTGGMILRLKQ